MGNQDKHEERILFAFLAALGIARSDFAHERTGPAGSRPDFKVALTSRNETVGVELTALTTEGNERGLRLLQGAAELIRTAIHTRIDERAELGERFAYRALVFELIGLPPKPRIKALIPAVVAWLESIDLTLGSKIRPSDPEIRTFIERVHVSKGPWKRPAVSTLVAGRGDLPSILERLLEKRRIALARDFKRHDQTWLVLHGEFSAIAAGASPLARDAMMEAAAAIGDHGFDEIYLFDTNEKEVLRFGWTPVTGSEADASAL